ncbi:Ig-like domain-containing protein [Brevibacillus laterosporus]|uniref:Ig-like domain-containing protein n=1 Tax=Brevibacillus laterosporus TaxID=1465 RepID=UPI0009DCAFAE
MNISSRDCDHHPDKKVIVKLSANTSFVAVGSIITFTARILNKKSKGILTNAFLFNETPTGTVFVPNSVTVNGFPQPGASPVTGISLGTIPERVKSISVTYQFRVVSVPSPAKIISQARLTGTLVFSKGRRIPITVLSNVVTIPFQGACIPLQAANNGIVVRKGEGIKSFIKIANPSRNTLLFKLLSSPKHGSLKLLIDGRYAYKPNHNFTGKDIFTVLVIDPICHSTAIVRVIVLVRAKFCDHHHKSSSSSCSHFQSSSSSQSDTFETSSSRSSYSSCSSHSSPSIHFSHSSSSSHSSPSSRSSSSSRSSHSSRSSRSSSSSRSSHSSHSSPSSHSSHSSDSNDSSYFSSCFESSTSKTCTEE